MPDCNVTDVLLDAAILLGDPAQEQFTNTVLLPFYGMAYRELFDVLVRRNLQTSIREVTYTLPASTTSLLPATAGITDMGEPMLLWERGNSDAVYVQMQSVGDLPQGNPDSALRFWKWMNNTFYFLGATQSVGLKIKYTATGAAPTSATGTVGIDNARTYLAYRAGSLAAATYDMAARAVDLKQEAFGPSMQPDATGGAMFGLIQPMVLEKQKRRGPSLPFRPRRNSITRQIW